nr:MAG: hypothetical protein [Porcellio scaber clopovirus]
MSTVTNDTPSCRSKKKKNQAFRIPSTQDEFFNNLKNSLLRNESRHRISPFKLNIVFKRYINKDKIFKMLKDLERELNIVFKKADLVKDESGETIKTKKDISRAVKNIILPIYKNLTSMIKDIDHINNVVKYNVIVICILHLKNYASDEFKKVLDVVIVKLFEKTKKSLEL